MKENQIWKIFYENRRKEKIWKIMYNTYNFAHLCIKLLSFQFLIISKDLYLVAIKNRGLCYIMIIFTTKFLRNQSQNFKVNI